MWDLRAVEEGPRRSEVPVHNTLKLRGPPPLGWLGCCDGQFSLSTYLDLEWAKRPPPSLCVSEKMFSEEGRPILELGGTLPWAEVLEWRKRGGGESKLNTGTHFPSHSLAFIFMMDKQPPKCELNKAFLLRLLQVLGHTGKKSARCIHQSLIMPQCRIRDICQPQTLPQESLHSKEEREQRGHTPLSTHLRPHMTIRGR